MSQYGIHVPEGMPAQTIDEVVDAADKMKDGAGEVCMFMRSPMGFCFARPHKLRKWVLQVVVKSQILAGGRGLGTFKSGLQGGVHICKATEAKSLAEKMLGQTLVTKQTGATGEAPSSSQPDSVRLPGAVHLVQYRKPPLYLC